MGLDFNRGLGLVSLKAFGIRTLNLFPLNLLVSIMFFTASLRRQNSLVSLAVSTELLWTRFMGSIWPLVILQLPTLK